MSWDSSKFLRPSQWPESDTWVITIDDEPVGYIGAERVPGLERLYEIHGCVDPFHRRKGFGSELLNALLDALTKKRVRAVSHKTNSVSEPGSRFLLNRGFSIEHVEWQMVLEDLTKLPAEEVTRRDYNIRCFAVREAAALFLQLYHDAFSNTPWFQPYENVKQIEDVISDPSELIFVFRDQHPVGFCWTHLEMGQRGVIEPIGITSDSQGQGLGSVLLRKSIESLIERGVMEIELGVWSQNKIAINLYRKFGFSFAESTTYLERDLYYKTIMS